jgi:N-acetylglucosaminyldiphosphoundecaprenol N-acetyl-beta-D-mannosaminyltransferase
MSNRIRFHDGRGHEVMKGAVAAASRSSSDRPAGAHQREIAIAQSLARPSTELDRNVGPTSPPTVHDDLSREVYCILGVPIDAVEMPTVLHVIEAAARNGTTFVISTPNLNFLVNSQRDEAFRESLLFSDLCPVDGMPIVWIARLMGIPINDRTAGSDIFEALKNRPSSRSAIKIFMFGAKEGVAAAAAKSLNTKIGGLSCVGWVCPGWGTVEELSQQKFVDQINASKADFLVASLGAIKGQLWLQRNHYDLRIPIRAHLGATINFQAGLVKRAPAILRRIGLEWLWRLKEEPHLWRRYFHDGTVLLFLTLTRVLPLAIQARSLRRRGARRELDLAIRRVEGPDTVTLGLSGYAVASHIGEAVRHFREVVGSQKRVVIDFSETRAVDSRFLGLLLMVRKQLKSRGRAPQCVGVPKRLQMSFRLNGLGYLLQ